jgi:hypothetical protein
VTGNQQRHKPYKLPRLERIHSLIHRTGHYRSLLSKMCRSCAFQPQFQNTVPYRPLAYAVTKLSEIRAENETHHCAEADFTFACCTTIMHALHVECTRTHWHLTSPRPSSMQYTLHKSSFLSFHQVCIIPWEFVAAHLLALSRLTSRFRKE